MSRGSASAQTMEAEPPDMRYQAEPGNKYNHLGLLYLPPHFKLTAKFARIPRIQPILIVVELTYPATFDSFHINPLSDNPP